MRGNENASSYLACISQEAGNSSFQSHHFQSPKFLQILAPKNPPELISVAGSSGSNPKPHGALKTFPGELENMFE